MRTLAPPFAYYGGKTTLASRIVQLLPEHRHYVEPFAGSLAVLLSKPPSLFETVNDLDGDLMTFWRVLRDQPDELMRVCYLTPHSRAEHQAAYDLEASSNDLERARRVWVCLTQGRGNTLRKTGWRYFEDPGRRGPTRSSRQYGVEMSSDDEHQALAEALHACRASVVLSGYASPLYDELYGDWHQVEVSAFTGQANTNGRRVEVLWSNRPLEGGLW